MVGTTASSRSSGNEIVPIMALLLRQYPGFCNPSFATVILPPGDIYRFSISQIGFRPLHLYIFQCFMPAVSYRLHAAQRLRSSRRVLRTTSSHNVYRKLSFQNSRQDLDQRRSTSQLLIEKRTRREKGSPYICRPKPEAKAYLELISAADIAVFKRRCQRVR